MMAIAWCTLFEWHLYNQNKNHIKLGISNQEADKKLSLTV
jgi:hypothetical protein